MGTISSTLTAPSNGEQTPSKLAMWICSVENNGRLRIESAYEPKIGGDHPFGDKQAGARLIAAAPDLLDALRPLAFFSGDFSDDEDRDRLNNLFANARAAIARALGRNSDDRVEGRFQP
jgi:hypothetical protein